MKCTDNGRGSAASVADMVDRVWRDRPGDAAWCLDLDRAHAVARDDSKESGKIGLALLMWLLGVPGILVLAFLFFA